jgi:hypothetical protein
VPSWPYHRFAGELQREPTAVESEPISRGFPHKRGHHGGTREKHFLGHGVAAEIEFESKV